MTYLKPPRIIALLSLAFMTVLTMSSIKFNHANVDARLNISIEGQPTIGDPKAPLSVVVFEEPKCSNCKIFNNNIFPLIKRDFIETHKIQYTVIPVSFLPHSMPAAIALMCVFHVNNDLFFTFLNYLYLHQPPENLDWTTTANLQDLAKQASPDISLDKLKHCIEQDTYRAQITKNTENALKLMGGMLKTPTIYVDGVEVREMSSEGIIRLINAELALKELSSNKLNNWSTSKPRS